MSKKLEQWKNDLKNFKSMNSSERVWLGGVYYIDGVYYTLEEISDKYIFYGLSSQLLTLSLDFCPDECFSESWTKTLYLNN